MNVLKHLGSVFMLLICLPIYAEEAIHDPTKPVLASSQTEDNASGFNLESILVGQMRTLAMINGQTVGVGSQINGARVLAIGKNHVVLLYSGQKRVLHLFGTRLWKAH